MERIEPLILEIYMNSSYFIALINSCRASKLTFKAKRKNLEYHTFSLVYIISILVPHIHIVIVTMTTRSYRVYTFSAREFQGTLI